MKMGFFINLGNGDTMHVESSESETWHQAINEVFGFLRRVQDEHVQQFTNRLLKVRIKEDDEEALPKERNQ